MRGVVIFLDPNLCVQQVHSDPAIAAKSSVPPPAISRVKTQSAYTNKEGRDVALGAPGLFTPAKKEELSTRTNVALYHYPWHFFPKHMKKLSNGKWKLEWSKRTIKSTRIWRIECMHFHLPATLPELFWMRLILQCTVGPRIDGKMGQLRHLFRTGLKKL
jgi:hypothetical protein